MVAAKFFRSRFVNNTAAVNTATTMAIAADSTAAGAIVVPPSATKLVSVDVHYADDSAALGQTNAEVTLVGDGIAGGTHSFGNPGGGDQLITGAGHPGVTAHYDTDIPVTATGNITCTAFIHGVDNGTQAIGVTLGFA